MHVNEIALSNNLDQIELEINHHKQIAGQSIWEIGRRLNHVKENDLAHGEFTNWVEKRLNISIQQARKFMKVTNELPKGKSTFFLGIEALYLISSLPEEEREKEHETSKGEAKTVDAMTVKELQELKKEIKQRDHQIEELRNKKPEVIEKEVVKEVKVEPHDYPSLKSDNQQLSSALKRARAEADSALKRNEFIEAQYDHLLKEREEVNEKSKRYDELTLAIKEMEGKMDAQQKRITMIKDVSGKLKKGNEMLDELSGLIYLTDFEELSRNEFMATELAKLFNRLNNFIDDFNKKINQTTILEGEIINE